jgi:3-oxoacyl-[acyl-carrier protein] reductase
MGGMNGRPDGSALVTGASRGIGAAIAKALAREGWPVGVNCRSDLDAADEVVAEIEAAGGEAIRVAADVTDPGAAEAMFAPLEERYGTVTVLVNNAGVRADGLAPTLDNGAWERVIATTLIGPFRFTRRALPKMMRARFGRVVNVASIAGPHASPGQSNYAAAKAGLIGFTKTAAAEVARRGVTINAIAPGLVETEMSTDAQEWLVPQIPAKRAGTPEEIASCIRFLASERASYVTGATLFADGGLTAMLDCCRAR